jgi:hypothetical protein
MLDQLCATLIELANDLSKPLAALDLGRTAVRPARSAAAPSGIARRDRSAYRVPAAQPTPDRASALAPHLVRLSGDWAQPGCSARGMGR